MLEFIRGINPIDQEPELSHRFGVFFFASGVLPNPIDLRFQRVGGLSTEVQLETVNEGGENLYAHRLPGKMSYNNLVLERGYVSGHVLDGGVPSPLNIEFNIAFSTFRFNPSNVLVTKFSEAGLPVGAWLFMKAYPVKWSVSDLDALSNSVAVDTMELAYTRFQLLRV
ncbi:MAG: phage tail protein [Bacteroidota bacterium]